MFVPFLWLRAGRPEDRLPRGGCPSAGPATHPPEAGDNQSDRPCAHGLTATPRSARGELECSPFGSRGAFPDSGIIGTDLFQVIERPRAFGYLDFIASRPRPGIPRRLIRVNPLCFRNRAVGVPPPARHAAVWTRGVAFIGGSCSNRIDVNHGPEDPECDHSRQCSYSSHTALLSLRPVWIGQCRGANQMHCHPPSVCTGRRCHLPSLIHAARPAAPSRRGPASHDPRL